MYNIRIILKFKNIHKLSNIARCYSCRLINHLYHDTSLKYSWFSCISWSTEYYHVFYIFLWLALCFTFLIAWLSITLVAWPHCLWLWNLSTQINVFWYLKFENVHFINHDIHKLTLISVVVFSFHLNRITCVCYF